VTPLHCPTNITRYTGSRGQRDILAWRLESRRIL
jgi:hypothetical protein